MQIALAGYDEHAVGPDEQLLRDQFNRHLCEAREDLVELGVDYSQVIDDNDSNAHIGRQMF
jgi:hypothetical protein